jgi:hypothetical protein
MISLGARKLAAPGAQRGSREKSGVREENNAEEKRGDARKEKGAQVIGTCAPRIIVHAAGAAA